MLRERGVIVVDEWIKFRAPPQVSELVRALRGELDALLIAKVWLHCEFEQNLLTIFSNLKKNLICTNRSNRLAMMSAQRRVA